MLKIPQNIHLAFLIALICAFPLLADLDYDPGIRAGIMPEGGFEVFLGGGHLTNPGSSEDTYHIVLDPSALPDGWSANFCAFGSCYPLEATSNLLPGRDTELSVHVFPVGAGAGTVTLTITSDRTGDSDTIIYWASNEPEVLIINDSGRPDVSLWYSNSFDNLTAIGGILNRIDIDFESLDLNDFSSVLWFTGPDYDDVFDETDTTVLAEYLSGGGKLILSSQGAGPFCDDEGISSWHETNLHCEWVDSDSSLTSFYGIPGTVFEGIAGALGCVGGPEEFDRPSILNPIGTAVPLMNYDAVGSPTSTIGHYSEMGSKLVYIPFPLEAISSSGIRDSVIAQSLAYVDGAGSIAENSKLPESQSIYAFPNPFNSAVTISIRDDVSSETNVQIFDIMGNAITSIDPNSVNTAVWDATNSIGEKVPAGIYFAKTNSVNSPTIKLLYVK